jgi:hypothetical protein
MYLVGHAIQVIRKEYCCLQIMVYAGSEPTYTYMTIVILKNNYLSTLFYLAEPETS